MHTASIVVHIESESALEAVVDAFSSLLGTWRSNGQILGRSWPMARGDLSICAYVSLPELASLDDQFSNRYITEAKLKLETVAGFSPEIRILGPDPESASHCMCDARKSMILFTTFIRVESPLTCGDCFASIPLYRIPATSCGEFWDVLSWESDYKACDTLQMGCRTGERFGMRQLFDPNSELSRQGRDLASRIESSTSTPTYYYLHKSKGRSLLAEEQRHCPVCSGDWRLPERLHGIFDFRCEPCRLLANIACNLR